MKKQNILRTVILTIVCSALVIGVRTHLSFEDTVLVSLVAIMSAVIDNKN